MILSTIKFTSISKFNLSHEHFPLKKEAFAQSFPLTFHSKIVTNIKYLLQFMFNNWREKEFFGEFIKRKLKKIFESEKENVSIEFRNKGSNVNWLWMNNQDKQKVE